MRRLGRSIIVTATMDRKLATSDPVQVEGAVSRERRNTKITEGPFNWALC